MLLKERILGYAFHVDDGRVRVVKEATSGWESMYLVFWLIVVSVFANFLAFVCLVGILMGLGAAGLITYGDGADDESWFGFLLALLAAGGAIFAAYFIKTLLVMLLPIESVVSVSENGSYNRVLSVFGTQFRKRDLGADASLECVVFEMRGGVWGCLMRMRPSKGRACRLFIPTGVSSSKSKTQRTCERIAEQMAARLGCAYDVVVK